MRTNDHNSSDTNEAPTRRRLRGLSELRDQLAAIIEPAQREIVIFAPVLEGYLFNSGAFARALASFAARHQRNLARILLEDVGASRRDNDRIVELARRLNHAILIHEVDPEDHGQHELYVVVDRKLYVQQLDISRPEAVLDLAGGIAASRLAAQFDERWDRSAPIVALHPLGL